MSISFVLERVIWGADCQDYWRRVTAGRGVRVLVKIIALVNKDEKHEGRLDRGRICDLDRKEKPYTVQIRSRPKAMARNWDFNFTCDEKPLGCMCDWI